MPQRLQMMHGGRHGQYHPSNGAGADVTQPADAGSRPELKRRGVSRVTPVTFQ